LILERKSSSRFLPPVGNKSAWIASKSSSTAGCFRAKSTSCLLNVRSGFSRLVLSKLAQEKTCLFESIFGQLDHRSPSLPHLVVDGIDAVELFERPEAQMRLGLVEGGGSARLARAMVTERSLYWFASVWTFCQKARLLATMRRFTRIHLARLAMTTSPSLTLGHGVRSRSCHR
jgi:hypothetical protein